MTKLSDTQSVILSAACARDGGFLLPVTAALKGGAVNMVLTSLIKKELAEEIRADPGMPTWREDEDGTPLTLRATAAAYEALGIVADTAPEEESAVGMADLSEPAPTEADTAPRARKVRDGSKQEAVIALLRRPEGASMTEIMEATAWQAHSVRGFIAGAVKKKLGLEVTSEKVESRGRVYRLNEPAE